MITSIHGRKIKTYLPYYYNESVIIDDLLNISGGELDVLFQLIGEIFSNQFVVNTDFLIEDWEDQFAIISNPSLSLDTRRAQILSFLIARPRLRRIDIESIVREFLTGASARTLQSHVNVSKITVSSVSGFVIGHTTYIGGESRILTDIIFATNELVFNSPITTYPYALVSQNFVTTVEHISSYTFDMIVDQTKITNQQSLIDAVERAKPAHLGWKLYGTVGQLGYYDDISSLLDSIDSSSDVVLLYDGT